MGARGLRLLPLTLLIVRAARRRPPVSLDGGVRVRPREAALHGIASLVVSFVLNAGAVLLLVPGSLADPALYLGEVARLGLHYLPVNAGVYWAIALGALATAALLERRSAPAVAPDEEPTLTVRSGRSSVRVRVSEIRWIEGAGD